MSYIQPSNYSHIHVKQCIGQTPEPKKPESVEQVGLVMKEMDKLYKTSFSEWIQNEDNIAYFCSIKGPLVNEYLKQDADRAMLALKWMSENWSIASIAELTLKLFYHHGVASDIFVKRLYTLVSDWEKAKIMELLAILLIGERPPIMAGFLKHWDVISGWDRTELTVLALGLAKGLRWSTEFCQSVLVDLTMLLQVDSTSQRSLLLVIGDEMEKPGEELESFGLLFELMIQEHHLNSRFSPAA